jgi:hypothetical protein
MFIYGAHHKCGSLFKEKTQEVNIEAKLEVKSGMFSLTKKSKVLIAAAAALALILMVAFPSLVYAQSSFTSTSQDSSTPKTRVLRAVGIAAENDSGVITKMPVNLTLVLEPIKANRTIAIFQVASGAVDVKGTTYTITGGKGAVVFNRHVVLLQAQGTGPAGQQVTLKLEGRYFWMWGHLYVIRILGSLQLDNTKLLVLMRAGIRA